MYDWEDILIIGDSFCEYRSEESHWPYLLACMLTGKYNVTQPARGRGFPGASWWSYRKELVRQLNKMPVKVLIIAHTDTNRIPHDDDLPLNSYSVKETTLDKEGVEEKIRTAGRLYYNELHSFEYAHWAQLQWFIELEKLIEEHKIEKVLHLPAFANSIPENYKIKHGIIFDQLLYSLADHQGSTRLVPISVPIYNHFSDEKNKKLAKTFYNWLSEDKQ